MTPTERAALARAIALAGTVRVTASPNPGVGCVVVRDGEVVGEGATETPPGRHAEVVALAMAGDAARGATAVVTLEPCAHHGRTPPCTEALLAAGVARVVIAHPDPNPLATGGVRRLRDAGVEVVGPDAAGDPFRDAVARQLEGFLTRVRAGRPHVTLKLAQTADGHLQAPEGRWVTGPAARRAVHRWRAEVDGVLVGSGTVLADDPRLDVRTVAARHQPRAVVFDARLRTPPTAQVCRPGTLLVTVADEGDDRRAATRAMLAERGVGVVDVPAGVGARGLDLDAALAAVAGEGFCTLLAEPGPTLAGALHVAGLIDRLVLHVAVGPGSGRARRVLPDPPGGRWRTERAGGAGEDLVLHLVPEPT
ncbi:MAG: bifunctional diaminohydroxyphosphoribosylaminopyrimidine deaminase/5-amino-6-(5-phosphoribosylamino)uracil reductase RibD [Nitriliruptoraceae bacterium]